MFESYPSDNEHLQKKLMTDILLMPIKNLDRQRRNKGDYNTVPIDEKSELYSELVVNVADYYMAGQAYYSRSNTATDEPVPGAPTELYLRKSVAEILAKINTLLGNLVITDFFGGEVELYIEDALRPITLQTKLHDELIPTLLKKNHPDMSDNELTERIKDIIAIPSNNPLKPSPHSTGGAVDAILRYKQASSGFVEGSNVPMGHFDGETSERINPDYFEKHKCQAEDDLLAQRNRRAYYAIMTGHAFGFDSGLANNPTEWWHWSYGDQMWAKLRHQPAAFYSIASTQK